MRKRNLKEETALNICSLSSKITANMNKVEATILIEKLSVILKKLSVAYSDIE